MDSMHFTFGSVSLIGFGDLITRREKHYVFIVMPLLFIGETLMALVFGYLQVGWLLLFKYALTKFC